MANIGDLKLFVRIAELQGLSSAARALSISPAAASQALKRLENHLGVRLFTRSTRALKLTPEGLRYLENTELALRILDNSERSLTHEGGILELTVSSDLGRNLLLDLFAQLKHDQPTLCIRMALSDKREDLLRGRFDAALRYGQSYALDLVELPVLKQHHFVACASPAYLSDHDLPDSPRQLMEHECIISTLDQPDNYWRFHQGEVIEEVRVKGHFQCDDTDVMRRWGLAGYGVIYLPLLNAAEDLLSGRLVPVLPGWEGKSAPLQLVLSHRTRITSSMRLLHRSLIEQCGARMTQLKERLQLPA